MKIETYQTIEDIVKAGGVLERGLNGQDYYVCKDQHGQPHRLDGPAIVFLDAETQWCINGYYQREDGIAVITVEGKEYYCKEVNLFQQPIAEK